MVHPLGKKRAIELCKLIHGFRNYIGGAYGDGNESDKESEDTDTPQAKSGMKVT